MTFLLTDLEGSTALWERAAEAMRPALARHDALVGAAVERHGGTLLRAQGAGDSHLAVFARAEDAVAAARAIQDAVLAEPWSTPTPLRVRIGLHTGEAEARDGGYLGATVNRCARLQEVGRGGETVLSEVTASLVRDALPAGLALRDLGERRLRGLSRPERAFLLVAADATFTWAPPREPDIWPRTLPVETTSLVGRGRDVEQIRAQFRSGARILTLTGPGGVGKTRLAVQAAVEVAEEIGGVAAFVALAAVVDPSLVGPTIARTLGASERPGRSIAATLIEHLRDKDLVLILDNFEQVAPAAPLVGELLGAAPGLRVLVTSRALLRISGEHDYPVQPLALPVGAANSVGENAVDDALRFGAVRLFVERARALKPDFALTDETAPIVVDVCRRLDGLPLAIELAAARVRLLPPRALLARLERRLPFLIAGPADLPARQRTLRGAIAWSYDLLDPEEQSLFRQLTVFAGGIGLDAAEAVCRVIVPEVDVLEGLASLLDKSLLRTVEHPDDEPRYAMLDTIREYGLEQLEASGDLDDARRRHAAYYLALTEDAEARLTGPDQARWLDRLDLEHDNLRAALQWCTEHDTGSGLRLAATLWRFWYVRAYFTEGRDWLARLLPLPEARVRTATRALALNGAGNLAYNQGDYAAAEACHQESLEIRRELGDRRGIAGSLNNLGLIARDRGDFAGATDLFE
ncbi:MAG: tetratricopeptide repeat protein, partial [Chloroflexota bacterium]|nr:tetratricopeptide repeat protein [Chloroflexota bacterium]